MTEPDYHKYKDPNKILGMDGSVNYYLYVMRGGWGIAVFCTHVIVSLGRVVQHLPSAGEQQV